MQICVLNLYYHHVTMHVRDEILDLPFSWQRAEGIMVDVNLFPDLADSRSPKQLAAELASQVVH